MSADPDRARAAIAEFLRAFGFDPANEPTLAETPQRVVDAWEKELLAGYSVDVLSLLRTESLPCRGRRGLVIARKISVSTLCPHHLLPAQGWATVAYLPGERMLGFGTLARLVDACARRLELQENITARVVELLMEGIGAKGAYCRMQLAHACMRIRGARQVDAWVETHQAAGDLEREPEATRLAVLLGARGKR